MTDVRLAWNPQLQAGSAGLADLVLSNGDLSTDQELETAVIVSLFTWRRAAPDDRPRGGERMGWWGDSFAEVEGDQIGSRLWLFFDEKITPAVMERLRAEIVLALAWMIEDGVAQRVDALVERSADDPNRVHALVTIYRQDGRAVDLSFDSLWNAVRA